MKVICKYIQLADLGDNDRDHVSEYVHLDEIDLIVGEEYTVYGILNRETQKWYYVCDEEDAEYPTPYHSSFFEQNDHCIPTEWSRPKHEPELLVPEIWATTPSFLELLVEGDSLAVAKFIELKAHYRKIDDQANQ